MNLKVKVRKGVLGKDGQPYAPRTIHGIRDGWNIPVPYTIEAFVSLLVDPKCTSIQIITEENKELILT